MKYRNSFRTVKIYTTGEAARIAGTHPATVRRWVLGYTATAGHMEPVFGQKYPLPQGKDLTVSFLELAEIVVAVAFRKEGVKLKVIRSAHGWAREKFNTPYPFAHLKLIEHGGHILHEYEEIAFPHSRKLKLVVLNLRGQYALPEIVKGQVLQFDFDIKQKLATRWFPHGRDIPIVVDPRFGAGRPTVQGRGLTTDILVKRSHFGESPEDIADDFMLTVAQVKTVLKYAA